VPKRLVSYRRNKRLVEAFSDAGVPFIVIGGTAMQFHFPERVPDDLDIVVAPTVEAGRRLLVALAAVGHPGNFTAEEYPQNSRPASIRLKPPNSRLYADVLRAAPWFNFDEQLNDAHDALLFNTPVKVASRRALLLCIEHIENPTAKNLRDMELLRRAAGEG